MEKRHRIWGRCVVVFLVSATISIAQQPRTNEPDTPIDQKTKTEVVHHLVEDLREQYVFPEIAAKLAQVLTENLDRGEYASIHGAKEFADILTREMREIAHDAHLQVSYTSEVPRIPPEKPGQLDPEMLRRIKDENFGFKKVEILDGNVGYLKVSAFANAEMAGKTAAAAIAFLANTQALIIDLRENHGGNPGMVALLASYFFSGDQLVHLNDLSIKQPGSTEYAVQQSWTLPYVPGDRYLDKELYILTSHQTPSAAEAFAYDLKVLKRATIVGEETWGGANPGKTALLSDHLLAFIPFGRASNPVTNTNWEGTGVLPDIKTPAADAVKTAYIAALGHLIQKSTDERERKTLNQFIQNVDENLRQGKPSLDSQ